MNVKGIWNVAKADLLERTRRFSFIAVCAVSVFLAFVSVPDINAPIVSIVMEPNVFKQGSNSSWVPIAIALCGGLLFAMIGFAFVNNNIPQDRRTGNLIAWQAMGMSKSNYILGKFISNLILLSFIWILIIIGAAMMIMLRFPGQILSLYDFFSPFLVIYPSIFFASAIAVLFGAVFGKRTKHISSLGVTLLFILFLINYSSSDLANPILRILDFSGYRWIMESINEQIISAIGRTVQETGILVFDGMFAESNGVKELFFHGLIRSNTYLLDKVGLIIFCIILLLISICFLDTRENHKFKEKSKAKEKIKEYDRYHGIFLNEIKIIFKNYPLIWWIGIMGLWFASIGINLEQTQNYIWVLMIILSVGVLSSIGCKEHESGIIESIITIDGALLKSIIYDYLIGFGYMLIISAPVIIRTVILDHGNYTCFGYVVFSLFAPALGCFLGEFTKNRRTFETVYLLLCFIILNKPEIMFWRQFIIVIFTVTIITASIVFLKRKAY